MKRKNLRKAFCILISVLLIATLFTGCTEWEEEGEGGEVEYDSELLNLKSTSVLSVDKNTGELTINRPTRASETPMGESGTWTVFVYICGSDLESENGAGTSDLEEMLAAKGSDSVRFVVETGGSSRWQMGDIDSSKLQRFVIQNGEMEQVYEEDVKSMGETAVLTDFLRWGVKEYPAEHMGVVFWNHGSGSINGVCFDEINDNDSLSLLEIDGALYSIYDEMTDRFEFIGYDACLMGTVESANVLASYARYMVGSEESEPGSGWDYTSIGNFLADNPNANGAEIGKVICDSFLAACKAEGDDEITTLSVIDLNKLDDTLKAFNTFAKSMYEAGADAGTLSDMVREIEGAENFGGNNKSEGYTNMVDLGGLIEACSSYTSGASEALSALQNAVVYKISGSQHQAASGLAVYYPLCLQGSAELSIFETVCVSPYYLSFIDRQDLGSAYASGCYEDGSEGGSEGEDDGYWYDEEGWYDDSWVYDEEGCWESYCEYDYDEGSDCYRRRSKSKDRWEYVEKVEPTGESRMITFKSMPELNEEGIYAFALDERGVENAAAVYAYIFQVSEDGKDLIEIGESFDVEADWENGVFYDMFDGYWLSLPDGQNLATYIVDYDENSIIYTSPILLNGRETNLRLRQDDKGITIEGAWDGIDEKTGAVSKNIVKLKDGDVIIPCYFSFDAETYEEGEWQGVEYKVSGTPEIVYGLLDEADYYYAFCIDDVYFDYYLTEFECFHVDENGETSYYE